MTEKHGGRVPQWNEDLNDFDDFAEECFWHKALAAAHVARSLRERNGAVWRLVKQMWQETGS